MKAIVDKGTNKAIYLLPDNEEVVITPNGMNADNITALDIKPDTSFIPLPSLTEVDGGII